MQINAHWGKANSPIYTHWWILNYSVTFRIALWTVLWNGSSAFSSTSKNKLGKWWQKSKHNYDDMYISRVSAFWTLVAVELENTEKSSKNERRCELPFAQYGIKLWLFLWENRQYLENTLEVCKFLSGTGKTNRKQLFISSHNLTDRRHYLKFLGSWFRKSQN